MHKSVMKTLASVSELATVDQDQDIAIFSCGFYNEKDRTTLD